MSDTIKGKKGAGFEYWSRRPCCGMTPGKFTKRRTHKLERRIKIELE